MVQVLKGVNSISKKVDEHSGLIGSHGKEAAKLVLQLMQETIKKLPPIEVVTCWANSKGAHKWDAMWQQLGQRTIENIAEGSRVLAILWQSAWLNGKGDTNFKKIQLIELQQKTLITKYSDHNFVPSFTLDHTEEFKKVCF